MVQSPLPDTITAFGGLRELSMYRTLFLSYPFVEIMIASTPNSCLNLLIYFICGDIA